MGEGNVQSAQASQPRESPRAIVIASPHSLPIDRRVDSPCSHEDGVYPSIMSSSEIRTLLQPPNAQESDARTLAHLNNTYKSLEDLEQGPDLDELVEQSRQRLEDLDTKVRSPT